MRAPAREVKRMRIYLIEKSNYQAEQEAEQRRKDQEAQDELERAKNEH